jgi:hypothetical protein
MILSMCLPALIALYPNCTVMEEAGEYQFYASLRFKFFITLYYLRTGTPFRVMEVLFGWSASSLSEWTHAITALIADVFQQFRVFPSVQDQYLMALEHASFVAKKGASLMQLYGTRINWGRDLTTDMKLKFQGAIGAIDGTFTLCCRFPNDIQELMYTGYKKFHAYKLVVVCSLFTKAILAIFICPATTSDSAVWTQDETVASLLQSGLYLLGDAAFNGLPDVIAPFRTEDINLMAQTNPVMAHAMRAFNQAHSSNRMSSEHVIGYLKLW